jgi:hypothetical protein
MNRLLAAVVIGTLFVLPPSLLAQDATAVCLAMVTDAAHNVGVQTSSSSFLNTIYSDYCEQDGSTKTSSFNAGLSAVVEDIPISLTGGSNDASTAMKNFCSHYQSTYQANSAAFDSTSIVVEKALESANQCLEIATRTQNTIAYKMITPQMLSVNFGIPSGQTLNIRGISHESSVACVGSKVDGSGVITYSTGSGQSVTAAAGTYSVSCTRQPFANQSGTALYNATGLIVDTNLGGLDIFWPQETILPITTASQLQGLITGLNTQVQQLQATVNFNLLPIGTILPWFVKNQSPPKGWAKCDGSDPTNCPNLTNLFLRGSSPDNVGAQGGSQTSPPIPQAGSNNRTGDGNGWSIDGNHYRSNDQITITLPLPPYVAVLYIKKVANQ